MVFRANIPAAYIDYVQPGNQVKLSVDGWIKIEATVAKLYPTKVTLPSGQSVYQVDIQSDELLQLSKLDQTGQAIISTNSENVALVPAWTVVGGDSIWIIRDGVPESFARLRLARFMVARLKLLMACHRMTRWW